MLVKWKLCLFAVLFITVHTRTYVGSLWSNARVDDCLSETFINYFRFFRLDYHWWGMLCICYVYIMHLVTTYNFKIRKKWQSKTKWHFVILIFWRKFWKQRFVVCTYLHVNTTYLLSISHCSADNVHSMTYGVWSDCIWQLIRKSIPWCQDKIKSFRKYKKCNISKQVFQNM